MTTAADDGLAAGAALYAALLESTGPNESRAGIHLTSHQLALVADASLPALRVAHSLLYDEMLSEDPRVGTTVRRQTVLTEIRRRENQPT